jgi:ELWxxDGT repeat protein
MISRETLYKVCSLLLCAAVLAGFASSPRSGRAAPAAASAGPYLVYDFNPSAGSGPRDLVQMNGSLYLITDFNQIEKLWIVENLGATPLQLAEFASNYANNLMEFPTVVGDTLFFSAEANADVYDLWKSDGTVAGTVLVKDIGPGSGTHSPLYHLADVNGTLLFAAREDMSGRRVWKSDGTESGTLMVKNYPPVVDITYSKFVSTGGLYFFVGTAGFSSSDKYKLWRSDGTAAGTIIPKDINPAGDAVYNMQNPDWIGVDGVLYFRADDGSGYSLWRSDGTPAGTYQVKGSTPGYPTHFASMDGKIFFGGNDAVLGRVLWESDGTANGTVVVKDINPQLLTNVNGTLFFMASDGVHGQELWKSDGTDAGTV